MSCCGNRDMAPAIAPLSEDFFNRSVELILPGHSSDIRLVYENDQWQNAGIEKSVEYKNLLERCKVLEREKKELKAKYDEALRKLAILSLEHEKLQNATEIHIKKNHRFNASVCKFYSKFKIMSCACRQQPVETYGYSTDIWSMTPQLKLSTASGPVEITYEDGVWSCTNSADPDIQKLHDSASQLERQKKHLEDKLRSIEEECRKKERAIEVILGSKKCTTVPRKKTPVFTAARNGNHVEKTLFSEVRSSATLL